MTRANDLYDRIRAGGYAEIVRMVQSEETEELFLDYKLASTEEPFRSLAEPDKENFARAVSGFSNSDGGVIIWGIMCSRFTDGRDVPTLEGCGIEDATAFKALLDGMVSGLTLPPVSEVESVAIAEKFGARAGFVVTHIPPGINVPIQAVTKRRHGFYMRAGSSFSPVPHGVLAGMFGRRPQARLHGEVIVLDAAYNQQEQRTMVTLGIWLKNSGRGVAKDAYYSIHTAAFPDVWGFTNGGQSGENGWSYQRTLQNFEWRLHAATLEKFQRLAPGEKRPVNNLYFYFHQNGQADFRINGSCGTDDSVSTTFSYSLSFAELMRVQELLSVDPSKDNVTACRNEAIELLNRPGRSSST
jgi:hypothetical protein